MGEAKKKTATTNEDRKRNMWDSASMRDAKVTLQGYETMWDETEGTVRTVAFKRGEALYMVKNGLVEAASVAKDKRDFGDDHVNGTYKEWYLEHGMTADEATRTVSFYEAASGLMHEHVIGSATELIPSHARYIATTMRKDKGPKKASEAYKLASDKANSEGSKLTVKTITGEYETLFPPKNRTTVKTEAQLRANAFNGRVKGLNEKARDAEELSDDVLLLVNGGELTNLVEGIVLLQARRNAAVEAKAARDAQAEEDEAKRQGEVNESSTIEAVG